MTGLLLFFCFMGHILWVLEMKEKINKYNIILTNNIIRCIVLIVRYVISVSYTHLDVYKRQSTTYAPWIVVEGNCKYYARVKVLRTVVEALEARIRQVKEEEKQKDKQLSLIHI